VALELNFKQELVAAFGQPIAENPTQVMIEAAFRHHRLDWRYLTIEVAPAGLKAAVEGARAMGFRGFNCTIPHKVAVIEHLDGLGESAALMGAVNCVVRREDRWIGENTDGKGFVQGLQRLCDPAGTSVVIFGAGGAARAITVEMALAGARRFTIVNRDQARGRTLVDLLNGKVRAETGRELAAEVAPWRGDYAVAADTDIVVNATSIGLYPDVEARLALDVGTLRPGMIVADVIPNPPRTRLVRDAEAQGCQVIDGLVMLVGQGRIGITYWTGIDPDERVMRQALEEVFGGSS
jgi:shikimate dehydrogenase